MHDKSLFGLCTHLTRGENLHIDSQGHCSNVKVKANVMLQLTLLLFLHTNCHEI